MQTQEERMLDPSLVLYLPFYKRDGVQFISDDCRGQLCTVTGALWTPQGRRFDEVDDNIVIPNNALLSSNTSQFAISGWYKTPNADTQAGVFDHTIYNKSVGASLGFYISSRGRSDGGSKGELFAFVLNDWTVHTDKRYDDNQFHFFTLNINRAGSVYFFIDGYADGTASLAAYVASDYSNTANVYIGTDSGSNNDFGGVIGEEMRHNRILSLAEHQNLYLATKWRYR